MKNWIKFILILLLILMGVFSGFVLRGSYISGQYDVYAISIYACHDGCSIATKNQTTGFLTNETWDCWDKCSGYIKEVLCEEE